jgi:general secretion pathway protein C
VIPASDAARTRTPLVMLLSRHGPAILSAAVGIAIAADVGRVAQRLSQVPAPALAAVTQGSAAPDLGSLAALFGKPPSAPGATAEVTAADLELTGTIAVDDPAAGFGILRRRGEPDRFYRAGDEVPGGGRLAEIYLDRVIIDAGVNRLTLRLPRAGLGGMAMVAALSRPRQPRWVEIAAEIPKSREGRLAHPVNALHSPLATALHLNAYVVDNHVLGYRINSGGSRPPIPGLPPKALIREINGVPLTDGDVAGRAIDSLPGAGVATFVIQTGDEQRSLTLDVSSLAALAATRSP